MDNARYADDMNDPLFEDKREPEASLARKVGFLASSSAYSPRPAAVVVKETHMAWVFLTDSAAYKLKKPVKRPYLDFSTLDARKKDCLDEVRLNRRLAPDVYLGVVALTLEPSGGLALDGRGEVVDWLVRMRRLPDDKMLDQVIGRGGEPREAVKRVGELLVEFYLGLAPADVDADSYVERFHAQHALNLDMFRRFESALDGARWRASVAGVEAYLDAEAETLKERARQGRVVEGHGDLRPQHVCLTEPPVIIDCLEFNRFLRLVDPFEDTAFLSLECSRLGADWVGEVVRRTLAAGLRDRPPEPLVAFHIVFRACVQARLALARIAESPDRSPTRWAERAESYLDAAARLGPRR